MMPIADIVKNVGKTLNDNSPAILTGLGVAGVFTTTYLGIAATFAASRLIQRDAAIREVEGNEEELSVKDAFKLVWPKYIPTVAMGAVTIAAIITSHNISARRQAAVVTLYTVTDRAFTEYREKATEILGKDAEREMQKDISRERMIKDDVGNREIIITGNGEHLCYDTMSGRTFMSNHDAIIKAMNELNTKIIRNEYASQNEWWLLLGLEPLVYGDELGWNHGNMLEVHFDAHVLPDGRPVLDIRYRTEPLHGYSRPF